MVGKPLDKRAMTATERQRRWRKKKRIERLRAEIKAYEQEAKRRTLKRP